MTTTFKKQKFHYLTTKYRDSILKWNDEIVEIDETKLTAGELTSLSYYLKKLGYLDSAEQSTSIGIS